MTPASILIYIILTVALFFFITEWIRADVVAVLVLVTLVITKVLTPEEALAGFSSNAVITIAALLVISSGLVRSGVVKWVADRLITISRDSRFLLVLVGTGIPGLLSGFINIVAAVSIFIPAALRLARQNGIDGSRLLLPMAVTSLMGANLSLIGASHNLVVDSLLQKSTSESFGLFEFTAIGAILVALTIGYTLLVGKKILPDRSSTQEKQHESDDDLVKIYDLNERLWELLVKPGSSVAGQPLHDLGIGRKYGLSIIAVFRGGAELSVEDGDFRFLEKDILAIGGSREMIMQLAGEHSGLTILGQPDAHEEFSWSLFEMIEVVVPPRSTVIGKTLRDIHMREETGLTCVALWREKRPYRTDARDRPLREGDGLMLFGTRDRVREFEPAPDFLWLHPPRREEAPRKLRHLAPVAALLFLAVILSTFFNLLPIAIAALLGAAGMIIIGTVSPGQAYASIDWRTIVLIGGMYPVGAALEKSGAASQMSEMIVSTAGVLGPLYALIAVTLLTVILTQPLHNAVVAVIMTPVAIQVANSLGANPKAFAVAVIVGASASFLMAVGHPAPMLVKKPGGYTNGDYLKFGVALIPLIVVVVAIMVPLIWGL
ncbi:SLC13 family permease [Desulfopila inferna]|uniref:SLC13 family permease n=1 Tax=Desulfopila inferna TaxID=468528 RepID=UPI0019641E46|nr:SLC13 family permease [Desulfopila inferna]MBM9605034.1 SLC13 family permease [Desulfopila inferna]